MEELMLFNVKTEIDNVLTEITNLLEGVELPELNVKHDIKKVQESSSLIDVIEYLSFLRALLEFTKDARIEKDAQDN